jgi:hypothetical protein
MAVSHKTAEALNAYQAGPFGYGAIDMNARWTNLSTDFMVTADSFTPPVSSRNVEQWKQVEIDPDVYQYDSGIMLFPLPRHHLNIVTLEMEFLFDGLFSDTGTKDNLSLISRIELCTKVNGEWVSQIRRAFNHGIRGVDETTRLHRRTCFQKTFLNWTTGYDTEQWAVRPTILYPAARFRIDTAFFRVKLLENSAS